MKLSHEEIKERYEARCAEFKTGEISEAVFAASLFALGYRGQAIRTEVKLNWPDENVRSRPKHLIRS